MRTKKATAPAAEPAPTRRLHLRDVPWVDALEQAPDDTFDGLYNPRQLSIRQILAMNLVVPHWQREPCWSPDQQRAYVGTLMRSLLPMPILLQSLRDGRVLVIDGQQRLVALGCLPDRAPTAARMDPLTGEWSVDGLSVAEFAWARQNDLHLLADEMADAQLAALVAGGRLQELLVTVNVFRSHCLPAQIARVLRAVATPGVVPTEEEIERMVAGVMEGDVR